MTYLCGIKLKLSNKMNKLTKRESEIMNYFWTQGEMFVKELLTLFPEPRPHVNTVSTMVRALEEKGFLSHKAYGNTYQYYPIVSRNEYSKQSLAGLVKNFFSDSYLNVVSSFVREEKVSIDELKALVERFEKENGKE